MAVKVFLDTNVYETANFSFGNRHFSKLHELILNDEAILDSEIIETISEDSEIEYDDSARYCPDCGCKLTFENDAGAFCIKCAPNH